MDLSTAINSYRFYDKNDNFYEICKLELKTNSSFNEKPFSGLWILKKNSYTGNAKVLRFSGTFDSMYNYIHEVPEGKVRNFCFNTPDEALETFLSQHSDVEIYS